jgi:hypothetical protein
MRNSRSAIRTERKYVYKVSAFGAMRDRIAEKEKENIKVQKKWRSIY